MRPGSENVVDMLIELAKCSIWLEELTASLYEQISSRIRDPLASSLMLVVSKQSRSHAEVMRSIGAALGYCDLDDKIDEARCLELVGEPGRATIELIRKIHNIKEINTDSYREILGDLEYFETGIGEETYTRILLPLIKTALTREELLNRCPSAVAYGPSTIRELATALLDIVVEEEKLHELIARRTLDLLEHAGKPR